MIKFMVGLAIGVIGTALIFNQIIKAEHRANSSLYATLNKCDQALKKALEK